jgi:hypothetical protein
MAQNGTAFRWSQSSHTAAALLADDNLTDEQIAEQAGISRRTLARWKDHPEFVAQVQQVVGQLERAALRLAIAQRRKRVARLNTDWLKLQQVRDERGTDPKMVGIPGGQTGLLVHRERAIGTGRNQTIIDEYEVDTGLLKALLDHEKQAAQELGQWSDKLEHGGIPGAPMKVEHDFDVDTYRANFQAIFGSGGTEPGTADTDGLHE